MYTLDHFQIEFPEENGHHIMFFFSQVTGKVFYINPTNIEGELNNAKMASAISNKLCILLHGDSGIEDDCDYLLDHIEELKGIVVKHFL